MDKYFKPKTTHYHIYRKAIITLIIIGIIIGGIYGGRELSWKEIAADEVAVIVNNLTGGIKLINRLAPSFITHSFRIFTY